MEIRSIEKSELMREEVPLASKPHAPTQQNKMGKNSKNHKCMACCNAPMANFHGTEIKVDAMWYCWAVANACDSLHHQVDHTAFLQTGTFVLINELHWDIYLGILSWLICIQDDISELNFSNWVPVNSFHYA
jgi:hypothetical protein